MTIDGFEDFEKDATATPVFDERLFDGVEWWAKKLRIEVAGIEHLPPGRALLVANHGFGWDMMFVMARIRAQTGRTVWALGEHMFWRIPFLRRVASRFGTVDGIQQNVDDLLERDQLVVVQPGGLREALKPRELRYRLLWGNRYGFIRAAMRAGAPIVPVASIGSDELFDFVGNAFEHGNRWLRRTGIPIPLPARILPIPHRVKLRFVVGEPIAVIQNDCPDEASMRRLRREVEGALHELLEEELARRVGITFGARHGA